MRSSSSSSSPFYCFIFCLFYYYQSVGGLRHQWHLAFCTHPLAIKHRVAGRCERTFIRITVSSDVRGRQYELYAHMQYTFACRIKFVWFLFTSRPIKIIMHETENKIRKEGKKRTSNCEQITSMPEPCALHSIARYWMPQTLEVVNVFLMFYDCICVTFSADIFFRPRFLHTLFWHFIQLPGCR